jgi:hypothetical protein
LKRAISPFLKIQIKRPLRQDSGYADFSDGLAGGRAAEFILIAMIALPSRRKDQGRGQELLARSLEPVAYLFGDRIPTGQNGPIENRSPLFSNRAGNLWFARLNIAGTLGFSWDWWWG